MGRNMIQSLLRRNKEVYCSNNHVRPRLESSLFYVSHELSIAADAATQVLFFSSTQHQRSI